MMIFDRFAIALGAVVDDAAVVVENIARNLPRHLLARLKEGRAEVVRCRGTTQSGAQCKRRPVPGSAHCYQHRNQANSDGRLLIVIEARDKAARMTSDISRKTWAATVTATTRLATLSSKLRAQVLSGEGISVLRQVARWMMESLRAQRRWVTSAMVLAFAAAVPVVFLIASNTLGRQVTPTDDPNAAGLFTLGGTRAPGTDFTGAYVLGVEHLSPESSMLQIFFPAGLETRTPGTDFTGAYVLGVEHLSAESSMLQIFVPAGVEGTYKAVVTASEGLEYQCVILHYYTDRLYCIGPRLPGESQINLRIFKIDEGDGSQSLVFETNYTVETAVAATQTPTRFLVRTADDSDSSDDHPPPATPAATEPPPPAEPTEPPPEPTEPPPPPPPEPKDKPKPCNKGHPENCPPTPDS